MIMKMFPILDKARPDIVRIRRLSGGGNAYDRSND
jgi:hypothetical protein